MIAAIAYDVSDVVFFCTLKQLQDSQRLKQHLAKKFAANFTPRRALLHMADADIPAEQRPDLTQLKNRRPTLPKISRFGP